MTILIISRPGDAHSVATQWALGQRRLPFRVVTWSDFPQRLSLAVQAGEGRPPTCSLASSGVDLLAGVKTLWNHRTMRERPHAEVDSADHPAIAQSVTLMIRGVVLAIERKAFAVNPIASRYAFDNKISQLMSAEACGLTIPATLVTNDIDALRRFQDRHSELIVKPLHFMKWKADNRDISAFTTILPPIDGLEEIAVAACPMIYQSRIRKRAEYRVVVFGSEILAFELDSQAVDETSLDWRVTSYKRMTIKSVTLPSDIESAILRFMRHVGFASASLDFAVDEAGRIIFFEANETGQYLWLEESCPEVPLLDFFVQFLEASTVSFRASRRRQPLRFETVREMLGDLCRAEAARHIDAPLDVRFPDLVAV